MKYETIDCLNLYEYNFCYGDWFFKILILKFFSSKEERRKDEKEKEMKKRMKIKMRRYFGWPKYKLPEDYYENDCYLDQHYYLPYMR